MCFTMQWLMQLLILVVVVGAIIAILKIIIPWAVSKMGEFGEAVNILMQILTIVFWAIIIIVVIYIAFALISCLWSMGGGSFRGLFPR